MTDVSVGVTAYKKYLAGVALLAGYDPVAALSRNTVENVDSMQWHADFRFKITDFSPLI